MAVSYLSLVQAARRFKTTKPTILLAIRRGKIPAHVVTVTQIRVNPKDVAAHVAAIPEWRRRNGSIGGLRKSANAKARAARLTRAAEA
jgi:excisionase family DNA binding protein